MKIDHKTEPKVNLLFVALGALIYSVAVLLLNDDITDADVVFTGVTGVLVLICTAMVTQGATDKEVPLSVHLSLMSLLRETGQTPMRVEPTVNPIRINLLVAFAALIAVAIFFSVYGGLSTAVVSPIVFGTSVFVAKKLADPEANDKVVPEEATMSLIEELARRVKSQKELPKK